MKIKNLFKISMLLAVILLFSGCLANNSIIHLPAYQGNMTEVKQAIQKGTNVDAPDIAGQTALMYAAEAGRMGIAKYLLSQGANINAQDTKFGRTPLILAIVGNQTIMAKYLINNGANVNIITKFNENSLHWVAVKGNISIAKILLDRGVNKNIRNIHGKTALDLAVEQNRDEIIHIIKNYSLKSDKKVDKYFSSSEKIKVVNETSINIKTPTKNIKKVEVKKTKSDKDEFNDWLSQ